MEVPENYKNRLQTYVKHSLLRAYLERLFMIIGQTQRIIRYVDCFSGPWNEQDENLEDTSIAISLSIIKKCHEALQRKGKQVKFHALYIEKDKIAFEKLESYLKASVSPDVITEAINGEFYNLRKDNPQLVRTE